jgi:hypothetical protein
MIVQHKPRKHRFMCIEGIALLSLSRIYDVEAHGGHLKPVTVISICISYPLNWAGFGVSITQLLCVLTKSINKEVEGGNTVVNAVWNKSWADARALSHKCGWKGAVVLQRARNSFCGELTRLLLVLKLLHFSGGLSCLLLNLRCHLVVSTATIM